MSTTTICPHCGCGKHWSNSTRWQDGFVCGTVVPFDGPTRRGEACQAIVQARTERSEARAGMAHALHALRCSVPYVGCGKDHTQVHKDAISTIEHLLRLQGAEAEAGGA